MKAGGALSWGLTEPPMGSRNQTFSCLRMGWGGVGGGCLLGLSSPLSCSHPTHSNGCFSGGGGEWAHSQFMFCFYEWKMEKAPKGTVLGGPKRGISAHAACGLALGQMGEWARGRAEGGRPRTWQALPSLLCLPTHVFLPSLSCPPPSPLPPRSKTQLSRAGRPHCSLDGSSEGLLGSWAPGTRLLCMLW